MADRRRSSRDLRVAAGLSLVCGILMATVGIASRDRPFIAAVCGIGAVAFALHALQRLRRARAADRRPPGPGAG